MVQSSSSGTAPHIYFKGVQMPTPSKLEVGIQDVDFDSGRTADGEMHRNRVGVKRKIKVGWPYMTLEDVHMVLSNVQDQEFSVTYLDPLVGGMAVGTFYAGDRTVPIYNYRIGLYEPFTFDLIEM